MTHHPAVRHIKSAHSQAKNWLPLASALITLVGFVLTMTEDDPKEMAVEKTAEKSEGDDTQPYPVVLVRPAPFYRNLLATLAQLAGALLRVVVGTFLVGALVWGYLAAGDVARAVMLTILLLGTVWLASLRVAK